MLDVSTPEFHHLVRILTKHAILWTEMVVDETIVYTNNLDEHLKIASRDLHPIICQIGGRSAKYCAEATKAVRGYGYDGINLNVDCPSSRVSGKRQFGAILMSNDHQDTCFDVVRAMRGASFENEEKEARECDLLTLHKNGIHAQEQTPVVSKNIPISVKTRVGIETSDGCCYDDLEYISTFISNLHQHGCNRFVIHARKCVIGGLLTPAQNRLVPPLNYPRFYDLCRRFPTCEFVLNGGIPGLEAAKRLCYGHDEEDCDVQSDHEGVHESNQHAVPCKICNASNGSCTAPISSKFIPSNLTGCMIGRACIENPSMFWDVDRYFYGMKDNPCQTRREVLEKYCLYLDKTYPRRCCDVDERMTLRIPAPNIDLPDWGCSLCQDYCGCRDDDDCNDNSGDDEYNYIQSDQERKIKISSRVIDRSLKPILGIFFGLPKSKLFRRECDRLSRDKQIRNCGPGYIVRKAMDAMPQYLLDEDFVRTEDISNVPKHVCPSSVQ